MSAADLAILSPTFFWFLSELNLILENPENLFAACIRRGHI